MLILDVQSEDLGCITRLDAVTLALSCVACDYGKIGTCDGKDGTSILSVRIELSLLGMGE